MRLGSGALQGRPGFLALGLDGGLEGGVVLLH
jgi:hypothetical protein